MEARPDRSPTVWQQIGTAVVNLTPRAAARALLMLGVVVALGWLLVRTWSALLPFQVGAVVAYLLLPLVNRLATRVPRSAAVLIVLAGSAVFLCGAVVLLVPPLVEQVAAAVNVLPSGSAIARFVADVQDYVKTLAPEQQSAITEVADRVVGTLRDNLGGVAQRAAGLLAVSVLSVVNFVSYVVGFLIIPIWLVYVLSDQPLGHAAVDRLLPRRARADFWAVVRIVDRVFSSYVRGQVVLAFSLFVVTFAGLTLLQLLGVEGLQFTLLLAVLAGLTEFIPVVGPLLGAIPAVFIALMHSWQSAVAVFALYFVLQQVVNSWLAPRIMGKAFSIHPAVLVVALIALGQLGLFWLVLAAPLLAMARDLFLYTLGRLSEPPHPAGVLPGETGETVALGLPPATVVARTDGVSAVGAARVPATPIPPDGVVPDNPGGAAPDFAGPRD